MIDSLGAFRGVAHDEHRLAQGRGFFLDASTLGGPTALPDLSNFHFYPNPVRGGRATVRYDLGQNARSVQLDIFDQTSYVVLHRNELPTAAGRQCRRPAS